MNIVLKNVHKLDSNFYKGIEINEFSERNECLVKFYGRNPWFDTEHVGSKFSDKLSKLLPEEQILEIIKKYIDDSKINYFTTDVRNRLRYRSMLIHTGGTKNLLFNVRNSKLMVVDDLIHNKYINDRYEFCYKNDSIKNIKIGFGDFSQYGIVNEKLCFDNDKGEDAIKLVLNSNLDGFLVSWEYEFIKEYIINILSKYNEEAFIGEIYDNKYNIQGYLIKVGDMKIYFSNFREIMCILDIVLKYNEELREMNKNNKRKQLKMEGF